MNSIIQFWFFYFAAAFFLLVMQSENVLMFTWIFHSYSENRLFISQAQAGTLSELWPFFMLQESSIL